MRTAFIAFLFGFLLPAVKLQAQNTDTSYWYDTHTLDYYDYDAVVGGLITSPGWSGITGNHIGTGIEIEQHLADHVCTRSRFIVGPNYFSITPGPLGAQMIKWSADASAKDAFGLIFLGEAMLFFSDGIAFPFSVSKRVGFIPGVFLARPDFYKNENGKWQGNLSTGVSLGVRTLPFPRCMITAQGDWSRYVLFLSSDYGYSFSIGLHYVLYDGVNGHLKGLLPHHNSGGLKLQ